MARNGTGTFSLVAGNPVVTGTVISSTWANNTLSDIAAALTASIANDGQTPIIADMSMDGFSLLNLLTQTRGNISTKAATTEFLSKNIGVASGVVTPSITNAGALVANTNCSWASSGSSTAVNITLSAPLSNFANALIFTGAKNLGGGGSGIMTSATNLLIFVNAGTTLSFAVFDGF